MRYATVALLSPFKAGHLGLKLHVQWALGMLGHEARPLWGRDADATSASSMGNRNGARRSDWRCQLCQCVHR